MSLLQRSAAYLLWLVPAGLCIGALWDMPYAYYELMRLPVGIVAAFLAGMIFLSGEKHAVPWAIAFGAVGLLFNPFQPVHLSREVWATIDVATAALFLANMFWGWGYDRRKKANSKKNDSQEG
ncbi:MAG: hypothetical protein QM773_13845 [Hyphomonadaceae bacterium]